MKRLVLASALALVACEGEPPGSFALLTPPRETFEAEAAPLLAKRCADVACHGTPRPFSLYAVGRRRMDPRATYLADPLTPAELDANYHATLGFLDAPRPRDTTLLQKALGAGGPGGHRGGAVFAAPSDPECRALARWIAGEPP